MSNHTYIKKDWWRLHCIVLVFQVERETVMRLVVRKGWIYHINKDMCYKWSDPMDHKSSKSKVKTKILRDLRNFIRDTITSFKDPCFPSFNFLLQEKLERDCSRKGGEKHSRFTEPKHWKYCNWKQEFQDIQAKPTGYYWIIEPLTLC